MCIKQFPKHHHTSLAFDTRLLLAFRMFVTMLAKSLSLAQKPLVASLLHHCVIKVTLLSMANVPVFKFCFSFRCLQKLEVQNVTQRQPSFHSSIFCPTLTPCWESPYRLSSACCLPVSLPLASGTAII